MRWPLLYEGGSDILVMWLNPPPLRCWTNGVCGAGMRERNNLLVRRCVAAWLIEKRCLMDVGEGHKSLHNLSMRWLKAYSASCSCRSYVAVDTVWIEPFDDRVSEALTERVGETGTSSFVSCEVGIAG